jgi:hypothetical protein
MIATTLVQLALFLLAASSQSFAGDNLLLFNAEEVAHAYRYQQQAGPRLQAPLLAQSCLYGKEEFAASFQGRKFSAPCRFITETIRHLKDSIDSGAVKYLFPLDTSHAILGVPVEVWERKYRDSSIEEMLHGFLKEPELVALYQVAQYVDPESSMQTSGAGIWGKRRNILGFYDGRRIEVLSPASSTAAAYEPQDYKWLAGFNFLTHSLGELQIVVSGVPITFDISFDNDRAIQFPSDPENVATRSQSLETAARVSNVLP